MAVEKGYSILIFPWRGTRVRRVVLPQRSVRHLILAGVLALSAAGWLAGDYLWMRWQRKGIRELRMEALAQREQLSVLQDQTKNLQTLLTNWKGLQQSIQASLPHSNRSSFNGRVAIAELEKSLASLQSELEELIASVPTAMPVGGRVTSGVGTRPSPWTGKPEFHSGLDIPNPVGTAVHAAANGVVKSTGVISGNGLTVVLSHGQEITTQYSHLSKVLVREGERVRKGQQIAESGNTGKSTSPHVHYEVRINGIPVDPRPHLIKQGPPSS